MANESRMKAAFLYNFTKFVEWPAERWGPPETPFVIGVLAGDDLAVHLERIARGQRVNGRYIAIQRLRGAEEIGSVHLLFVGRAAEAQLGPVCGRPGVLAVGESAAFLAQGGTIAFAEAENQLRFAINMEAAARAGLKISAQLQKLALAVHKAP